MSAPRRRPLPFMQFFIADYRRDTRHLTTEQHGAYLLVLFAMWEQQGGLPETHVERATELSPAGWKRSREALAEFFTIRKGVWTNRRIKRDLAAIATDARKKAAAGRAGGLAKARNAAKAKPVPGEILAPARKCYPSATSNTDREVRHAHTTAERELPFDHAAESARVRAAGDAACPPDREHPEVARLAAQREQAEAHALRARHDHEHALATLGERAQAARVVPIGRRPRAGRDATRGNPSPGAAS